MRRILAIVGLTAALALAPVPAIAQDDDVLDVDSVTVVLADILDDGILNDVGLCIIVGSCDDAA